jgi:hypothetical protein
MSPIHSKSLTDNLSDYSVGASLTSYTAPWNLRISRLSDTEGVEPPIAARWRYSTTSADISHHLTFRPKGPLDEFSEGNLQMRLISHLLVDMIPDAGIPDMWEALADIWERHEPLGPSANKLMALVRRTPIKAGRRYERPTFPVSEG